MDINAWRAARSATGPGKPYLKRPAGSTGVEGTGWPPVLPGVGSLWDSPGFEEISARTGVVDLSPEMKLNVAAAPVKTPMAAMVAFPNVVDIMMLYRQDAASRL